MSEKNVFKTLSFTNMQEYLDTLAIVSAREGVLVITFNGNINRTQGDERYNLSWEEKETF